MPGQTRLAVAWPAIARFQCSYLSHASGQFPFLVNTWLLLPLHSGTRSDSHKGFGGSEIVSVVICLRGFKMYWSRIAVINSSARPRLLPNRREGLRGPIVRVQSMLNTRNQNSKIILYSPSHVHHVHKITLCDEGLKGNFMHVTIIWSQKLYYIYIFF